MKNELESSDMWERERERDGRKRKIYATERRIIRNDHSLDVGDQDVHARRLI